jgi:uncharacterized protein
MGKDDSQGKRRGIVARVIHFEIHASKPRELIAFYSELFGWKFTKWGEIDYWMVETGPPDKPGIGGGLLQRPPCNGQSGQWLNAFACTVQIESLDTTVAKAVALGAQIALPKMPIPGVGWLAYIKDLDGNLLGLMQPDPSAT